MKALLLAAGLSALASGSVHVPSPKPSPPPTLTANDAREVLQLLQGTQVQGNSVPETYRLMVLLAKISQPPAESSKK